jgi:hypothetical protein
MSQETVIADILPPLILQISPSLSNSWCPFSGVEKASLAIEPRRSFHSSLDGTYGMTVSDLVGSIEFDIGCRVSPYHQHFHNQSDTIDGIALNFGLQKRDSG